MLKLKLHKIPSMQCVCQVCSIGTSHTGNIYICWGKQVVVAFFSFMLVTLNTFELPSGNIQHNYLVKFPHNSGINIEDTLDIMFLHLLKNILTCLKMMIDVLRPEKVHSLNFLFTFFLNITQFVVLKQCYMSNILPSINSMSDIRFN